MCFLVDTVQFAHLQILDEVSSCPPFSDSSSLNAALGEKTVFIDWGWKIMGRGRLAVKF